MDTLKIQLVEGAELEKILRLTLIVSLIASRLCCAEEFEIKRLDDTSLKFEGEINELSASALLLAFKPADTSLIIHSPGGSAHAAAAIANYIHEHRLTVKVDSLCASACANFIFLVAPKKILMPGAIVGLHGSSLTGKSATELSELRKQALPDWRKVGVIKPSHTDDLFKMFSDNARLELMVLDYAGIRVDLHRHAADVLEKTWQNLDVSKRKNGETNFVLKTSQGERRYSGAEEKQVFSDMQAFMEKQIKVELTMITGGRYSNLLYFPSQAVLERYGVKGIVSYAYPTSQTELQRYPIYKEYEKSNVIVADF